MGIVSLSDFKLVAQTHARLLESFCFDWIKVFILFSRSDVSLLVVLEKKYIELNVGKAVDNMTQGNYIPTDSMKSGDDYSNLVHNIGVGAYVDSDKTNLTYLVG